MTSVTSLDDLAPFFATVCQSITKQQTKSHNKRRDKGKSGGDKAVTPSDIISAIIERDFLENLAA